MEILNIAALRDAIGTSNQMSYLLGYYSPGDGGGGSFYWNSQSVEADDGGSIIGKPGQQGRWERIMSEKISCLWFGAKGKGNNDTAFVQKALDVAAARNIGELYFPGTASPYVITTVNVPGNIIITGDKAVIKTTTDGYGFKVNAVADVTIRQLEFDGSLQTTTGNFCSVLLTNANNITVEHCTFRDGRFGLWVDTVTNIDIMHNTFTGYKNWGNYILTTDNCRFMGNVAYNNDQDGFKFAGIQTGLPITARNVLVSGNIAYNNKQDGLDFAINNISNIVVENNLFYDNENYGITFKSIYSSTEVNNLDLRFNTLNNNLKGGINTQWIEAKPKQFNINGNRVTSSVETNKTGDGLRCQDIDKDTRVFDNIIDGYAYGIRLINASFSEVYNNISGRNYRNFVVETQTPVVEGQPIVVKTSEGIRLYRNTMTGNATAVFVGRINVSDLYVYDSDFSKNTSEGYRIDFQPIPVTPPPTLPVEIPSNFISFNNILGYSTQLPTARSLAGDLVINTNPAAINCFGWRALNKAASPVWEKYGTTTP